MRDLIAARLAQYREELRQVEHDLAQTEQNRQVLLSRVIACRGIIQELTTLTQQVEMRQAQVAEAGV